MKIEEEREMMEATFQPKINKTKVKSKVVGHQI